MVRGQTWTSLVVGAGLVAGLAACDPPPPPPPRPVFTAVAAVAGPDAHPGDGSCAVTGGGCSLQAAVDEANALGRARVVVDPGSRHPAGTVTIASDVEVVRGPDTHTGISGPLALVDIVVASGGVLTVQSVTGLRSVRVEGRLVLDGASMGDASGGAPTGGALVEVAPTGTAVVHRSHLVGWGARPIQNDGTLLVRYSTIWGPNATSSGGVPAVVTGPAGTTTLAATFFLGAAPEHMAPACGGRMPVSQGWNQSYDDSCALAGPGDRSGIVDTDSTPGWSQDEEGNDVPSPRLDGVPVGALGCAVGVTPTINAVPAHDSDGDGVPGCEIGADQAIP